MFRPKAIASSKSQKQEHCSVHIFLCTFLSQFFRAHVHFFTRTPCELLATPLGRHLHTSRRLWAWNLEQFAGVRIFGIGVVSSRFSSPTFCNCLTWESVPRIGKWSDGHFVGWPLLEVRSCKLCISAIANHPLCALPTRALQACILHFALLVELEQTFAMQLWKWSDLIFSGGNLRGHDISSVLVPRRRKVPCCLEGINNSLERQSRPWLHIINLLKVPKFISWMLWNWIASAKWAKSNLLMQTPRNSCIEARGTLACSKVWIGWKASKDPRMSILRGGDETLCKL